MENEANINLSIIRPTQRRREKQKNNSVIKDSEAVANLKERLPNIDNLFKVFGRIGHGTFSTVLLATLRGSEDLPKEDRKYFAIKHLIPTIHPKRILKELKCLMDIGGADNVVGINLCLRWNESVAFVTPYLAHKPFVEYFDQMDVCEVKNYLRNLLIALKRVHKFNVIHRDVKPSNFLYDRANKKFMLVDFGLAQTLTNETGACHHIEALRKRRLSVGFNANQKDAKKVCHQDSVNGVPEPNDKMPLKQLNSISLPKGSQTLLKHLESPLSRQVKSAILGRTMTDKLLQKNKNSLPPLIRETNLPKYNTNRSRAGGEETNKCFCFGENKVCNICLVKKEIYAARAGTPGFRPPEVLLKYVDQTCAVDIWAVGVIFLAILSGVYPFFKAQNDYTALVEIVTLFGDDAIRRTAYCLGRKFTINRKYKPLDLRRLCVRLRNRADINRSELIAERDCSECSNCSQKTFDCLCARTKHHLEPCGPDNFPDSAYDLLERLLEVNPHVRISAEDALEHPFLREES